MLSQPIFETIYLPIPIEWLQGGGGQIRHYGVIPDNFMIGWLKGQKIETWKNGPKSGLLLACNGVGYEIQLTQKHLMEIIDQDTCVLWTHQIQKDDGASLFGFPNKPARDLFRILIGISGIGPQMAIALLEGSEVKDLVCAIVQGDLKTLCKAQGIGKRTAERIAVELRTKLAHFNCSDPSMSLVENGIVHSNQLSSSSLKEMESTLSNLGYEDLEIRRAIRAVATNQGSNSSEPNKKTLSPENTEAWLKATLLWLAQEAA